MNRNVAFLVFWCVLPIAIGYLIDPTGTPHRPCNRTICLHKKFSCPCGKTGYVFDNLYQCPYPDSDYCVDCDPIEHLLCERFKYCADCRYPVDHCTKCPEKQRGYYCEILENGTELYIPYKEGLEHIRRDEKNIVLDLTLETPDKQALKKEKSVKEELKLEKPVKEGLTVEKPVKGGLSLEKPVKEDLTSEKSVKEELTLEKLPKKDLALEKSVKEDLTLEKPVEEDIHLKEGLKTITEDLTSVKPVKKEFLNATDIVLELIPKKPVKEDLAGKKISREGLTLEVKQIYIPRGVNIHEHGSRRQRALVRRASLKGCNFPDALRTAEVRCTVYEMKIKCILKCVWGYKYELGPEKTIACRFNKGKWTPSGFDECKPYVNCALQFKSPGDMHCVANYLDKPSFCSILCEEYDDIPATVERRYECREDGTWSPPLPFCVEKKE